MDAYAAAHDGLAPVVVDHLGAPLSNPLCMDSRLGRPAAASRTPRTGWWVSRAVACAVPQYRPAVRSAPGAS